MESKDQSTISFISLNQSNIDISSISKHEEKKYTNVKINLNEISKAFDEVKNLRKNFNLEEYDKLTHIIRKNIRDIRKLYKSQEKEKLLKIKELKNSDNKLKFNSNHQNSSTNPSNLMTNIQSNPGNNTKSNTNTNSNLGQESNNINSIKIKSSNVFSKLNETLLSENGTENNYIDGAGEPKKNIYELYNILLELVSFLLCYDDIFINYENKSAFFSPKLFLQISTLHFFVDIKKQDFILMIINKICNILCKYNHLNKKDKLIKKILELNEKEINKLKDVFILIINL